MHTRRSCRRRMVMARPPGRAHVVYVCVPHVSHVSRVRRLCATFGQTRVSAAAHEMLIDDFFEYRCVFPPSSRTAVTWACIDAKDLSGSRLHVRFDALYGLFVPCAVTVARTSGPSTYLTASLRASAPGWAATTLVRCCSWREQARWVLS